MDDFSFGGVIRSFRVRGDSRLRKKSEPGVLDWFCVIIVRAKDVALCGLTGGVCVTQWKNANRVISE